MKRVEGHELISSYGNTKITTAEQASTINAGTYPRRYPTSKDKKKPQQDGSRDTIKSNRPIPGK